MASSSFGIKKGGNGYPTMRGSSLLNIMEQLRNVWAQLEAEREAIIQQQDASDDFTTPSQVYGFATGDGTISEPVAQAAFGELDALVGNHAAAVKQACARFLQ